MLHRPARWTATTLGRLVLLLALPLALLAALHPPNEYRATLGIDALDCDGPLGTYLLAVPVLLVYLLGFVGHLIAPRTRLNLLIALLCLALCVAVTVNVARALAEARQQEAACRDH